MTKAGGEAMEARLGKMVYQTVALGVGILIACMSIVTTILVSFIGKISVVLHKFQKM